MVARINHLFSGDMPVVAFQEVPFLSAAQRAAIWSVGSVLVCTPIREGMNAFPLEFITVHAQQHDAPTVVLSEFTAAARVLSGALYVNPWSIIETVQAYRKALQLPREEREGRFAKLAAYVLSNPTSHWIHMLLKDIASIPLNKEAKEISLGLGYNRLVIEMKPNFKQLQAHFLVDAWKEARQRVVFLDYGGTLVDQDSYKGIDRLRAFSGKGEWRIPPSRVLEALSRICSYQNTWVFVVSGRSKEEVQGCLQGVPFLGMASEEGYFYRLPGEWVKGVGMRHRQQWTCLHENREDAWRETAVSLMQRFCTMTNGTFIETKESAVLWQFKDADPVWAVWVHYP